ncbi:MAG: FG-GAP repeat domain-containing protein [Thermodesulfobacteriota bacterium]
MLILLFVFSPLRAEAAVFPVPSLEWTWNSSLVEPTFIQVMMSPEAADLDGDGIPEVIFIAFQDRGWQDGGILRAIHGNDGSEYFNVIDPALRTYAGSDLAVGDIDNDGLPEIVAITQTGEVVCFENDGTWKWTSKANVGHRRAVAIADLDNDAVPEIIAGRTVLNNDGSTRWVGTAGSGYTAFAADLDLDGLPEVIAGNTAYRNDGTIYWTAAVSGSARDAVANFIKGPFPEVVTVAGGNVHMWGYDGTPIWGPVAIPSAGGAGPPLVADFDGDGFLDIGVAGYDTYTVFNHDGTGKWKVPINDSSSGAAGATAFDFDKDGAYEIVYSDHDLLRILNGADGAVLFEAKGPSATLLEQPIVLDVDNDGFAEIVTPLNNYARPGANTGIEVYGTAQQWPSARKIWNQYTYHVTNIHDNATVPVVEKNHWEFFSYNNFNAQTYLGIDPVPDLKANGSDGPITVSTGTLVSVDGALDPNIYLGDNADWWVWAETIFGTYWYRPGFGWGPSVTPVITYAGPLFPLSPRNILSQVLPVGSYALHFDVDLNMNGLKDAPMFSDTVTLNVGP